jgi:hypothetical protein
MDDEEILFEHYKGGIYRFIGLGTHTETGEYLSIYEAVEPTTERKIWVRPKHVFDAVVTINGKEVPRFRRV